MVPLTRRRLLQATAGLLTGLAGCSRSSTSDGSTETPLQGENFERNPESYALRASGERPPAWIPEEETGTTTRKATAGPPEYARRQGLVASEAVAERIRFADVDGADAARRFVTDTDFDSETLYLHFYPVRECHRLELCHVRWSDTEIDTQFGSYYRDADVSCRVDARDGLTWLIRIPDTLDPDAVTRRGSGWSSNGCRRRRRERDDGTTTDAPDLGPVTNATRTTSGDAPSATTTGNSPSETTTEDEP